MFAEWNNKKFKLLDSMELNKSSREVSFSDIKIDFEDKTIDDLPLYLQEIKLINEDNTTKFTGYVNDCSLPELRTTNKLERTLSISLLSPRALTTKRTVTIVRTDKIQNILNLILAPLYQDGFVINSYNVKERAITVKFISKTIEECLNILSNKLGLYWNIDELKRIQIEDIEFLFNKPSISVDSNNYIEKIKGLQYLKPTMEGYDYANIINVKNARVFIEEDIEETFTLKQNDTYNFPHPIDISLQTAERVLASSGLFGNSTPSFIQNLLISYNDISSAEVQSIFNFNGNPNDDQLFMTNISTNDKDGELFVLKMDNMFSNLAIGFSYKGQESVRINRIFTQTALRYSNMKLLNWNEIEKKAGIITPSGQIEKTIDVQEKWFTVEELIDYIRNQFTINDNYVSSIKLKYDEDNNLKIGDRLEINLPELLTHGNFIITNMSETIDGNAPTEYIAELRNTNILENYIDLFRNNGQEEQESQIEVEYLVEHAEEDTVNEIHEIKTETYYHTLNFELR